MTVTNREALGHVRFCDDCVYPGDSGFLFGTVNQDAPCFRCGNNAGIHVLDPKVNQPRLAGFYHPQFTTCVELLPFPLIIWDTNGYYRELGISPKASRREIREAFQRLNGHESARLTYITKQLLDDEVRARYDATPLGAFFRDDEVEDWIRKAKAAMVRDFLARGEAVPEELMEDGEVVDEMVLDSPFSVEEDVPAVSSRRGLWPYGYYVWQSPIEDDGRLAQWQALLSATLCRRKVHRELTVGLQGAVDEAVVVLPVGYRVVVYLDYRERPTDELAEQAVSQLLHLSDQGLVPHETRRDDDGTRIP